MPEKDSAPIPSARHRSSTSLHLFDRLCHSSNIGLARRQQGDAIPPRVHFPTGRIGEAHAVVFLGSDESSFVKRHGFRGGWRSHKGVCDNCGPRDRGAQKPGWSIDRGIIL
ncbi:short-chain dehydrogenase/reductase family protein [Penicillium canariense]|uniref:Short-chain dehydrogenase/reductase family protein n=1 Tax=Penicillium canariense TaxID=189055 RepID=A0A9W9HPX4_9EURO|nr:short-chain dehydrogenase/reductase family protein [Penicillium canariense]KAJ5152719.1 short-chain dehydrogenase/reductase family protein [Penicillium canariense]